jgi:hypothetical protein
MGKIKLLLAFILPVVLLSGFELIHIFVFRLQYGDIVVWISIGISIISGFAILNPLLKGHRIILGILYFVGMLILLLIYGILFFGMVTGLAL